jgi:hypothetical protein
MPVFGFGNRNAERKGVGKIGGMFGLAMFAAAATAMWWNESRTVNQAAAIAELSKQAVEVSIAAVKPEFDNKAIYVNGLLETDQGVRDDYFAFGGDNILVMKRNVEMYQWVKHRRNKRDVWEEEWSDDAESDGGGHSNPSFPVQSGTFGAADAHLGALHVAEPQVEELSAAKTFALPSELDSKLSDDGWRANGSDGLYRGEGSPSSPQIGDVRVSFSLLEETQVSAMGRQVSGAIAPYAAKNGYEVFFIEEGKVPPKVLTQHAESSNSTIAYVVRGGSGFGMALGMGIAFSGLVSWLTWIPLLGPLIERFAFWLGGLIGGTLALLVFMGAWLWTHPLAMVATLALLSLGFIAYGMKKRNEPTILASGGPPPPPGFGGPGTPPPPPR